MKILGADDEKLALEMLGNAIAEAQPEAQTFLFDKPAELLRFARETPCDVAFLDIDMREMNGLQIAKELKDLRPSINIVFVTGHSDYMGEAFSLHASGYVLKPVTSEAIVREMENLRCPVQRKTNAKLYVKTFGNFEVFADGCPVQFVRKKTKELFAYLVSRRGAVCSNAEIAAILWEEKPDSSSLQSHLRNLVSDLHQVLKSIGEEDVLVKKRGHLGVMENKLSCDYYDFCRGEVSAINSYAGEFMTQYSWAEFTNGYLERQVLK